MATTTTSSSSLQLTSTTAPGKVFESREQLAMHYKSDWHKYNLKRREAGLPGLLEGDFRARFEAAKSLRLESKTAGKDHLKKKNKKNDSKTSNEGKGAAVVDSDEGVQISSSPQEQACAGAVATTQGDDDDRAAAAKVGEKQEQEEPASSTPPPFDSATRMQDHVAVDDGEKHQKQKQAALEEEAMMEINPRQCLFDRHISATVHANVDRMQFKYGFFIPDREYLVDLEGLVGYCHEKIKLGHMCLWCQRVFPTFVSCKQHMISKRHTKLLYQAGQDLEDLAVFYDFAEADADFMTKLVGTTTAQQQLQPMEVDEEEEGQQQKQPQQDDGEDDDWEDVTDDEMEADDDNNNNRDGDTGEEEDEDGSFYNLYKEGVAKMGLDVTPLGELVFPDGRIVGHRALRHYYKQHLPSTSRQYRTSSTAVSAARLGASERLYRGRVYNLQQNEQAALALSSRQAGGMLGAGIVASGRAGKGILVKTGVGIGGGDASFYDFSNLSVYRYRAAVRKARLGEQYGRRLHQRTNQNMNRMDKKANRLMNGVSVAHAAR